MRCRLVTWNIHSCVGTDGAYAPERIAEVLMALEADVVGLQEVDWRRPARDGRDQLEIVATRLGMTAVAGPNLRDSAGEYGNALLTRFDVDRVARIRLAHDGREPRGALDVLLGSAGFRLRVLVAHLGLKRWERRRQVATLRNAIANGVEADALALLADLNEWAPPPLSGPSLTPVPFPVRATGRTFPSRFPWFRLDEILLRPRPGVLEHAVVSDPTARLASDHLPVVADVTWDEPGRGAAGVTVS